jgi:hypothetical protein
VTEEASGPPPTPPPQPDRSLAYAIAASAILIAVAVIGGTSVARLSAPSPIPAAPATAVRSGPASPAPIEPPSRDTAPFVFTQPLSAGCAAGDAVYVVSDGGAIGRFAFDRWQLIDTISRSFVAATCVGDRLYAVGGGGRIATIDDREQTLRIDTIGPQDLFGVTPLADGLLVVGGGGLVQRQVAAGWGQYASGIDEDLTAIVAFGPVSAWAVGTGGVSYRLEPAGWRPVATHVTATLRAIAARAVDDAVAVGDDGTILLWSNGWRTVEAPGIKMALHAALAVGDATYIAGDKGTLLRLTRQAGTPVLTRVDLGTTCTLRGLFARGSEVWVIGSDAGKAAVWRIGAGAPFRWGECP